MNGIVALIYLEQLSNENVDKLLHEHTIKEPGNIKTGILEMILAYINLVLQDTYVTATEAENVKFLKSFLK